MIQNDKIKQSRRISFFLLFIYKDQLDYEFERQKRTRQRRIKINSKIQQQQQQKLIKQF